MKPEELFEGLLKDYINNSVDQVVIESISPSKSLNFSDILQGVQLLYEVQVTVSESAGFNPSQQAVLSSVRVLLLLLH